MVAKSGKKQEGIRIELENVLDMGMLLEKKSYLCEIDTSITGN